MIRMHYLMNLKNKLLINDSTENVIALFYSFLYQYIFIIC